MSLYEILNIEKTASQADIKKAYKVLALKLHPDKNPDEDAKAKFQDLQRIYAVLSNPERRKLYDETGCLDEAEQLFGDADELKVYFGKLTVEDIIDFEAEYLGSAEERSELIQLYEQYEGDMSLVFKFMVCSDPDFDSHRFMDILYEEIDSGNVKKHKVFTKWVKTVKPGARPKDPFKDRHKDESSELNALIEAIKGKRKPGRMDSLVADLEEKYGGKGKKRNKRKEPEVSEADFQAAQERVKTQKPRKKKGKRKV